jgi:hypothetical protein
MITTILLIIIILQLLIFIEIDNSYIKERLEKIKQETK